MVAARLVAVVLGLIVMLGIAQTAVAETDNKMAALLADRVEIDARGRLIAQGSVEVLFDDWRLQAPRIIYDPALSELTIDGPLRLQDSAGGVVMLAEAAALSDTLRDGLMQGAELVLRERLRITATTLARRDGRYSRMERAAASSCRVCTPGAPPLWEIRATRIEHDADSRQMDFWNAQLRLAGVPVLWLPRLRLPDPTLKRAEGFLAPGLRSTTALGLGIEARYFKPLGPSRDLTFSPFLGGSGTALFGVRYRQAYETGQIDVQGIAGFGIDDSGLRGQIRAQGGFGLRRGFGLGFDITGVSDPAVPSDFGISDSDRVESRAQISRIRRDELIEARLTRRTSLRDPDIDDGRAAFVLDGQWLRRVPLPPQYGAAQMQVEAYGIRRERDATGTVLSGIGRISATGHWRGERILANGMVAGAEAEASADFYRVTPERDSTYTATRLTPSGAVDLAWPQIRPTAAPDGYDVIEPRVQLVGGRLGASGAVENADSLTPELDEGNLFDFSRFVGADRREAGPRANLGLTWSRFAPDGSVRSVALGRVLRDTGPEDYGGTGDEPAIRAQWLLAGRVANWRGLDLAARGAFDADTTLERADVRMDYGRGGHGMGARWLWTRADPLAPEPLQQIDISELSAEVRLALAQGWRATSTGRFDLNAQEPTQAGLRLAYANECLRVDLSLSRRLSSSTTLDQSTELGLMVELLGFGGSSEAFGPTRTCR